MLKLLCLPLLVAICFACAEDVKPVKKESILGFWEYTSVTYDGTDLSETGFTVSNYLHLNEDFTYGKCYILGTWSLNQNKLSLSHPSGNRPGLTYTVLSVTDETLQLLIQASPNEYGIAPKEFDENTVISIVETFQRFKE